MQITEAHLGYHVTAVNTNACQRFGYPYRVACEDLVVLGSTREFDQTQLHDEVVNKLLDLLLGKGTCGKVSLCIAVKEGGSTAKAHCRTVLLLHRTQISEVNRLDCFLHIGGGLGNIAAIGCSHFLHHLKSNHLLGELLAKADHIVCHNASGGILLRLLILNQIVDTIQGNTSVVADDTSAAVSVRKSRDDM